MVDELSPLDNIIASDRFMLRTSKLSIGHERIVGTDGRTYGRTDVRTDTFEIDFKDFPGPSGGEFKNALMLCQ